MESEVKKGSNRSGTGKKGGVKGPYRFTPETIAILDQQSNATAYMERAIMVLHWLGSQPELRQQLADAAFEQAQPLQAIEQYDESGFTAEMKTVLTRLNLVWDALRIK